MAMTENSTRLQALIVDDEPLARQGLELLLSKCERIGVVQQARNGTEAVDLIRRNAPDIVFLDVQMPEMDGFQVIEQVGPVRMPAVIFVTAHDRYAIQAFEINALDYLLKPVSRERFHEALRRIDARVRHDERAERLMSLLETLTGQHKHLSRLAIRSADKTYFVDLAEVDWMQAAENYVQLHAGTARHLVHVPFQTLADALDPERFMRIHRSLIVNLQRIKEVQSAGHGEFVLVLRSGERLQSSRKYHESIKRWISNPF